MSDKDELEQLRKKNANLHRFVQDLWDSKLKQLRDETCLIKARGFMTNKFYMECGCKFEMPEGEVPYYCPNCGKKTRWFVVPTKPFIPEYEDEDEPDNTGKTCKVATQVEGYADNEKHVIRGVPPHCSLCGAEIIPGSTEYCPKCGARIEENK